ncbi:serine/threonine kinase 16 [Zalerion maritima]|uniref:Serine/threonine kinase 16 n=1 Tax=Zalerion maritima TaxID=339359 RepID=A0AAD5WMA6_9PEZI|nr:serine/threonine kinase 16 [Zalerion maritima]
MKHNDIGSREAAIDGHHVEMYPGTEIMEDYAGSHLVHSHNDKRGAVLIPHPSDNLDDPLNWSPFWKWTVVATQAITILTGVISALSVSPLTLVFEAEWNKSEHAIAVLTSNLVLVTGYTNFILVPLAEVFGRRFVLLACSLITLGASIWHGAAQSYSSFMGARIMIAVGMSISESLMPMVISDVFFLHERGRFVGIYFFFLFNAMFLGPLIAGSCEKHFGDWRTFYWIASSFCAASTVAAFFLHPETKYKRELPEEVAHPVVTTVVGEKVDIEQFENPGNNGGGSGGGGGSSSSDQQRIDRDPALGNGKPSKQQFKLIQGMDKDALKKVSRHVVTPIHLLIFPIVVFGSWVFTSAANGLLLINYTQSGALSASPYNFDSGQIGLSNLALACGGTIGVFTAGPLSDWIAMYLTRRNHGIREPEMRLPTLVPFILLSALGIIITGLGFEYGWPWEAVIVVGFGNIGLMTVALSTVGITYAVDSYKPVAGQIMTIATVVKNTFGFGMGYYITEWVADDGYIPAYMMQLSVVVGPAILGIVVFMIFGKRLRKLSRNSKVHTF